MQKKTYRYIYIAVFSLVSLFCSTAAHAQKADTAIIDTSAKLPRKIDSSAHQLCLNIDLVSPVRNAYYTDRYGFEGALDYYVRNEYYLVFESGWGGSDVSYTDLKYSTHNTFYRFGFNKALLARDNKKDWDMMFFGLRAAFALVDRSPSSFTVVDSVWGNASGSQGSTKFTAIWAELAGGMRVELVKGLFAGWTARGKFLLNAKSFNVYAPLYLAGYGRGDKNTVFDFNLYISYGIRWKRKYLK